MHAQNQAFPLAEEKQETTNRGRNGRVAQRSVADTQR